MMDTTRTPRRRLTLVLLTVIAIAIAGTGAVAAASSTQPRAVAQHRTHPDKSKPTIVLVHGSWADASGWNRVTLRLQRDGFTVIAPANPQRGIASDAAYLASVLETIDGPIVLVGHSYGGAVITNAATGNANVKALVYIAGFAPDLGETLDGIQAMNPGSEVGPSTLVFRPFPGGVDAYLAPSAFPSAFAADVPRATARVMAATQRPISGSILTEASGVPAWKTIPSWYLVPTRDKIIPPATERFMAKRAGAHTIEVRSSHVAMISHPDATTNLIRSAVRHTD
jgi:pimeloyl-ACP methyl ester carboxylesterase